MQSAEGFAIEFVDERIGWNAMINSEVPCKTIALKTTTPGRVSVTIAAD